MEGCQIPLLRAGYFLPNPGIRNLDLERTNLDINPGHCIRVKQSFVAEF